MTEEQEDSPGSADVADGEAVNPRAEKGDRADAINDEQAPEDFASDHRFGPDEDSLDSESDPINDSEQESTTDIHAENINSRRDTNIAGRDINQYFEEASRLALIEPGTIKRVAKIFVPSENYKSHEADEFSAILASRVVVVTGSEGTGKLTTAIRLADELTTRQDQTGSIWRCSRRAPGDDLLTLVKRAAEESAGALIVEKIFESGLQIDEITSHSLLSLTEALKPSHRSSGCYLILTSRRAQELDRCVDIPTLSVDEVDLDKILLRTLEASEWNLKDRYKSEIADPSAWKDLKRNLQRPAQVHAFVRNLERETEVPDDEGERRNLWISVAKNAADPGKDYLARWFESLESHERLFGFFVLFFEGVSQSQVVDLFSQAIRTLRKQGIEELKDPISFHVDASARRLRLQSIAATLDWEEPVYRAHLLSYEFHSSQPLLVEAGHALLENLEEVISIHSATVRQGLGRLLGMLARLVPVPIGRRLDLLAKGSQEAQIIASFAIRALVGADEDQATNNSEENPGRRAGVGYAHSALKILERWSKADDYRQRWTAAASVGQAYDGLVRQCGTGIRRQLSEILAQAAMGLGKESKERAKKEAQSSPAEQKKLYWSWVWAARNSVSFSLARILEREGTRDFIEIFDWWLSDDRSAEYRQVALRGVAQFMERFQWHREEQVPRLERLFTAVLQAALPGEERERRHLKPLVTKAFLGLVQGQKREQVGSKCVNQLAFNLATFLPADRRRRLADFISLAWRDGQEAALASKIRTRCLAMEGIMIRPPVAGMVILIVDPLLFQRMQGKPEPETTTKKRQIDWDDTGEELTLRVAGLLSQRWRLEIATLGRTGKYPSVNELILTCRLLGEHMTLLHPQQLAAPILHSFNEAPRLVVILTRSPVADIEEIRAGVVHTIVIACDPMVSQKIREVEGVECICLATNAESGTRKALVDSFDAVGGAALSASIPSAWEPFIDGLPVFPDQPVADAWQAIETWMTQIELGPPEGSEADLEGEGRPSSPARDPVHHLCGVVGWLATRDLGKAAEQLAEWLLREPSAPERAQDYPEPNGEERPSVLRLLAAAAARFLLRLHRGSSLVARSSEFQKLFDPLCKALAIADPVDGPASVLETIEHWLQDPSWTTYLAGDLQNGRGRLLRWAEKHQPLHVDSLQQLLPEQATTDSVGLWSQLRYFTGGGSRLAIPELRLGYRYGIIVLTEMIPAYRALVGDLLKCRDIDSKIQPILFELGCSAPNWTGNQELVLPSSRYSYPPLLGPILEQPALQPASVAYVLVLGARRILDAADLANGPWWNHIVRFQGSERGKGDPLRWLRAKEQQSQASSEFLRQAVLETAERTARPLHGRFAAATIGGSYVD